MRNGTNKINVKRRIGFLRTTGAPSPMTPLTDQQKKARNKKAKQAKKSRKQNRK